MTKAKNVRKETRFKPDPGSIAEVCFGAASKSFKAEHKALILSESYRGCAIILALAPDVAVGDKMRLKVGNLAPLVAQVRWVIALDEHVQKIGFMYLQ